MKITKIEQLKGKRVSVEINGYYYTCLDVSFILGNNLAEGDEVDKDFFNAVMLESELPRAVDKLVYSLGSSMKTYLECKRYLYDKKFHTLVVEQALAKVLSYGYIDDKKYVEAYVRSHEKDRGEYRLKLELEQKGVDEKIIDEYFAAYPLDEEDAAFAVAKKYMKNKVYDVKTVVKLKNHLLSKGYGYDTVSAVFKRLKVEED